MWGRAVWRDHLEWLQEAFRVPDGDEEVGPLGMDEAADRLHALSTVAIEAMSFLEDSTHLLDRDDDSQTEENSQASETLLPSYAPCRRRPTVTAGPTATSGPPFKNLPKFVKIIYMYEEPYLRHCLTKHLKKPQKSLRKNVAKQLRVLHAVQHRTGRA